MGPRKSTARNPTTRAGQKRNRRLPAYSASRTVRAGGFRADQVKSRNAVAEWRAFNTAGRGCVYPRLRRCPRPVGVSGKDSTARESAASLVLCIQIAEGRVRNGRGHGHRARGHTSQGYFGPGRKPPARNGARASWLSGPNGSHRSKAGRFLDRQVRSHESRIQEICRCRRLPGTKVLEIPIPQRQRTLSFSEAMLLFRDKTDRPGPSTWELGTYPTGQDEYPVSGLSWYEAAAFAQFSGKSLPTVFHWYRAADMGRFSDILEVSNFSGKGPAPAGNYSGLGPFGTYDMAGNVKEWCLNSSGDRKYILGGASTDLPYMYNQPDARLPFERLATHGVRLVKYLRPDALSETLTAPISFEAADYRNMKPVPDSVFHIYEGLYSYDRTPLEAKIESEDDSSPYWRRQRITFRAAYGNETVIAYLFLPKNGSPPYQTVVYFPHGGAQMFHTVQDTQLSLIDFMVKSGRALLFPIYKDTYERLGNPPDSGTSAERDETIQQAKDLRRSVDYLETRPDIDNRRLAYYGISWGAVDGPIMLAVETRFKAAVLAAGGCNNQKILPEVDPMKFASRVKVPVLMINGRYDFVIPLETCQEPMFRLFGVPDQDKRHVLFDTGHAPPQLPVMKETLNWLDHYLGPVK